MILYLFRYTRGCLVSVTLVWQRGSDCIINTVQKRVVINSGTATKRIARRSDTRTRGVHSAAEADTHMNSKHNQLK